MFDFIKRFFKKEKAKDIPPMPKRNEIIDIMYGKSLEALADEVIEVLYSKDRTMRYVITEDKNGIFHYTLQIIYQFDSEEWKYIYENENTLPAMWAPHPDANCASIFDSKENALNEIRSEPYYKEYFK